MADHCIYKSFQALELSKTDSTFLLQWIAKSIFFYSVFFHQVKESQLLLYKRLIVEPFGVFHIYLKKYKKHSAIMTNKYIFANIFNLIKTKQSS